jgi:hypothetical protein
MFFLIVVSLVFVAISWWVARLGNAVGYLGVAFFGLGLVVFVIKLLPNSSYCASHKKVSPYAVCFAATRSNGATRANSASRIWA